MPQRPRSLEELPGMAPATAQKLQRLGYTTIESLATASIRELSETLGETPAYKLVSEARKCLVSVPFMRADEYMKIRLTIEKLSTGCKALNNLLDGGLESQSINEFYGEFGTGKSQLCHQLCVSVQLPRERGGLEGGAMYVDSENTFRPERIVQITRHLGLDSESVLKNIVYAEALTSDHQMHLLDNADAQFKEHNIRLIIIDSLIAHFRSEYIGREMLAERQQKLDRHLHRLVRLIRAFNALAVITNQVMSRPDAFGDFVSPAGGHILGHASHTRVFLRKTTGPRLRIARLMASPSLPEGGECIFKITENGVEDVSDSRRTQRSE